MTKRNNLTPKYLLPTLLGFLCFLAGMLALLSSPHIARADTLCVKPEGGGGCFSSINTALTTANISDTIRVATGTYTENVYITKTVTLEGGWNITFTQRDPALFTTTIRPADPTVAVVTVQGQFGNWSVVAPTIDGFTITGGRSDNHGGGIRMNDSNATVSHNIIADNTAYLFGGGVWVQRGAPLFSNNQIRNNALGILGGSNYGGGISLENTQATLTGNIIASNVVTGGQGAGVGIEGGGPILLDGNTISGNTLLAVTGAGFIHGGGIAMEYAQATLIGNVIASNVVTASFGYGGGVAVSYGGPVELSGNTIMSNSIAYGIFLDGPGKAASYADPLVPDGSAGGAGGGVSLQYVTATVSSNLIQGNIAADIYYGYGGGMYVYSGTVGMDHNTIQNNIAGTTPNQNVRDYGGGLYMLKGIVTMDGDIISNNRASADTNRGQGGGLLSNESDVALNGVRITNNRAYSEGGVSFLTGFHSGFPAFTMTNSLVANNVANTYGGVTIDTNTPGTMTNNTIVNNGDRGIDTVSPLTLTNNIIMSNTVGVYTVSPYTVTETYNDFYANDTNAQGFTLDPTDLTVNPHLTADYHLSPGSPVIDAGTHTRAPDDDIDSEPRPMKGTSGLFKIDIGADEFTGPVQVNQHLATDPADFTLIGPGNPHDNPDSTGSNDWIGFALMGGDVNGDSRDDLFVGAPNWSDDFDNNVNDSGRVFGLYNNGTRRLGVLDLYTSTASLEVRSWIHQQHIGQAFDSADLDGDGVNDLIIGSGGGPTAQFTGTVYVFAGGAGLSGTRTLSPTMQADWRFKPVEQTGSFSGPGQQAAGQLDGAGPDDLIVGEALATGPGNRTNAGAVYVFFGSSSLPPLWDLATMPASLSIYGPQNDAELGWLTVADLDDDGTLDLTARTRNTIYVFYGPLPAGTIDLATTPADATITNAPDGRLEAGDINGDGKADLLISGGGEVNIVLGGILPVTQTLDNATWARFTGVNTGVASPALWTADWNDDGKAEVLIGERSEERVLVVYGSQALQGTADILDRADWIIHGELDNDPLETDQFGYSLGSGDLDDDGAADLILGSRSHSVDDHPNHFDDAGAIYVLYGAHGQPVGTPTPSVVVGTPTPTRTGTVPTSTRTATPATPLPTSTICPITFTDVPVGSTFYEFIRCLACRGIINGYPDGTFKPNNLVTRGQLSKIVSNSAGFNDPQSTQMFEDVPVGSTFFDFIGRLASRGYIAGYPCGSAGEPCVPPANRPYFRPNNNATRGQISKIVSNAAGFIEPVSGQTFEDVPPGSTFYDFIERLASRGVMSGYPCGGAGEPCVPPGNLPYFRPNNNATRGQTSKIVSNTFFPGCQTPFHNE
jgi:hypothetical protein